MKKLFILLLALTLVFSLVACKGNKPAEGTDTKDGGSEAVGMVDVPGEDTDTRPDGIELVTNDKIQEATDYVNKNNKEITYAELEKLLGAPGAHFKEFDEVDDTRGEITKIVCWYSQDNSIHIKFMANKDTPDDLKLFMSSSTMMSSENK